MFKRKIEEELKRWKQHQSIQRKAFVLKGLRQVGKTKSITEFAKSNYKHVVYINFKLEPNLKIAFSGNLDVDTLITNISSLKSDAIFVPFETVIVLDEIQECAGARASLKSFVENDNRFDVIASGSLLGIKGYNKKYNGGSAVGYEHTVYLKPMDFEEFLWAKGVNDDVISYVKDCFEKHEQIREPIHSAFNRYFHEYLCVGGMPAVLNVYLATNDLNQARQEQRDILESYKDDFGKHLDEYEREKVDKTLLARIIKVFDSIPAQLAKENKKFMYSQIEKKASSNQYGPAIQWLIDYGLITLCYNLRLMESPLSGNKNNECFKIFVADTGLFVAMLDKDTVGDIMFGDLGQYKGAIYENIIADGFYKMNRDLFYFSKDSGLEVDFVTRYQKDITLVEVKATTGNTKSSKTILSNKTLYPMVKGLIKLGDYNVGEAFDNNGDFKLTIPHYLVFCLEEK